MFLETYHIIALHHNLRHPPPLFTCLISSASYGPLSGHQLFLLVEGWERMLLFSMTKPAFSVFTPRQVARSLGDLSFYYSCQFWELATLNQTRDIYFCTNLASQHRKLRRKNIYIPFDQIAQGGITLSYRSIAHLIRMPYSQPRNTSRRAY